MTLTASVSRDGPFPGPWFIWNAFATTLDGVSSVRVVWERYVAPFTLERREVVTVVTPPTTQADAALPGEE